MIKLKPGTLSSLLSIFLLNKEQKLINSIISEVMKFQNEFRLMFTFN